MQDRGRWIETRKQVLRGIKNQVHLLLGQECDDLRSYARSYKEAFLGYWNHSDRSALLRSVNQASVVLGGDFHAFAQSQRAHLRLLREVEGPLVLALECFESKDQKHLDQYLAGDLSEPEFLKQIRWQEKWGFPWSHYRPLIRLAQEKGFKIFGINKHYKGDSVKALSKRDRHGFLEIEKIRKRHLNSKLYVIFGDLHLGYDHLPVLVEMGLDLKSHELLLIYQNSELLYFDLAAKKMETDVEVLKGADNKFCIMGSPPWVKWQSYLMYLEQTYDCDLGEEEGVDYTEYMISLIEFAGLDLKLAFSGADVQVYDSSFELYWQSIVDSLTLVERKMASYLVEKDSSFFLPAGGKFFLSRYSLNHTASLAGQYIHAKLCQRKQNLWSFPDHFLPLIWVEAVGFFFSKLINHKRKAESLAQIRSQLSALDEKDLGREPLMLVLDQRFSEFVRIHSGRVRKRTFLPSRREHYLDSSKILGQMMGERLFLAFNQGRLGREKLLEYLRFDVLSLDFENFYFQLVKRLESSVQIDLEEYRL